MRALAGCLLAVLLGTAPPLAAQELGRLFLTPSQRATLDVRRAERVPDKPAAEVVVESPTTRIDGQVQRSSGRSTVWINGQPVREGAQSEGLRMTPAQGGADGVTLSIGEGDRSVRLRVGESMNRDTGEVRDMLGDGEVRVSGAPRSRAAAR